MIPVTKTFLPPIEEYLTHLQKVWDLKWLTNRGPLIRELEDKIKDVLRVKHIIITNNGTIPLQIAVKLFGNHGEVITTPFSYVATTSSIVWENCKPVFVDIDPDHLTIDEKKIEAAITSKTTAILATHVFGNPCNVEVIETIAKKHNLKVIYDGAHCFGVNYNNTSIFNYGDVSTCSFHATKLFQTGEGGALFCNSSELYEKLFYSHNFGHNGPEDFLAPGINGKSSELHAAMGLTVLPYVNRIITDRKKIIDYYLKNLSPGKLKVLKIREGTEWNYSYFPVIFESETVLLEAIKKLNESGIFPRRYFYPSLNTLRYLNTQKMPVSESVAQTIACLPLYSGLEENDLERICNIINSVL
ncbi:MAG: aminotransferase DegT [Bacteroidetes bacterium]|jgi:dTDP-4-amino-4,6-dideoxygalactose transaminase|nr:aminotransferase DegT [Bacteroidota bacterium]